MRNGLVGKGNPHFSRECYTGQKACNEFLDAPLLAKGDPIKQRVSAREKAPNEKTPIGVNKNLLSSGKGVVVTGLRVALLERRVRCGVGVFLFQDGVSGGQRFSRPARPPPLFFAAAERIFRILGVETV